MNSKTVFQIGMAIIVLILIVACAGYSTKEPVPDGNKKGNAFIQKFDQNKDGKVIRDEFPGPDNVFERFDQNEDGIIDESEAPEGPPRS